MLAGGRSVPSPPVGRPQQRGRQADTRIKSSLPPPITMQLDHQGPAVTYSETGLQATPRGLLSLPLNWHSVMYDSRWQPTKKRRRLPEPTLNGYGDRNRRKRLPRRNRKSRSSTGYGDVMLGISWRRKELGSKKSTTINAGLLEPVLTPITNPLGWCEYEWSRKGMHESPTWAGDLWSISPMNHQQLATRMVCSWGLVKVYQWTRQSTYICPPAPHVIEAFNHKVNHGQPQGAGCPRTGSPTVCPCIAVCILLQ